MSSETKRAGDARFSRADVARIAALARLEVTELELDLYARQLSGILEHAEEMQRVNTDGVPPYAAALSGDAWREDVAVPSLPLERALQNAPQGDRLAGTFVVPKVIG